MSSLGVALQFGVSLEPMADCSDTGSVVGAVL